MATKIIALALVFLFVAFIIWRFPRKRPADELRHQTGSDDWRV